MEEQTTDVQQETTAQQETTETAEQTEAQEQTPENQEPEYTDYDDEGDDGGEEEKLEETEKKPEEETAETGEQPYTQEEFNELDPYDVDPAKLPQAARDVHQRYMDIYARQILPEMQELRAFKQKVLGDIQRAKQNQQVPRDEFNREVRARACRALGVSEIEDFNSEHQIELARQASNLEMELRDRAQRQNQPTPEQQQQQTIAQNARSAYNDMVAEMPDFKAIDRFAAKEVQNMPYSRSMQIIADLRSGDPQKIKSIYRGFAERYRKSVSPNTTKKEAAPPKVMGGSTVSDKSGMANFDGWSGASADEQSRMLVRAGLLDK